MKGRDKDVNDSSSSRKAKSSIKLMRVYFHVQIRKTVILKEKYSTLKGFVLN